jgi:hypothetical protein
MNSFSVGFLLCLAGLCLFKVAEWLVVRTHKRKIPVLGILIVGFILLGIWLCLLPETNAEWTVRKFAESKSQLAHLYSDLKSFADQHGGHFPAKLSDLVANGFETDASLFHTPGEPVGVSIRTLTRAQQVAIVDYPYFAAYYYFGNGVSVSDSPETVLLAEDPVDIIRPDDDKNHIVKLNGQIVIVTLANLNAIVSEHGIKQRTGSGLNWHSTLP